MIFCLTFEISNLSQILSLEHSYENAQVSIFQKTTLIQERLKSIVYLVTFQLLLNCGRFYGNVKLKTKLEIKYLENKKIHQILHISFNWIHSLDEKAFFTF